MGRRKGGEKVEMEKGDWERGKGKVEREKGRGSWEREKGEGEGVEKYVMKNGNPGSFFSPQVRYFFSSSADLAD